SLTKNRVSTLVNIIGLAIGMAAFALIIQYVRYELSYDRFHRNGDRIYRIQQDRYNKGLITTQWAAGCSAVGQAIYENFDQVEDFTRFTITDGVFSRGETQFREEAVYLADTSFFEIFSFEIITGDPGTALREPLVMFLSESTAKKYFGDVDPIGESLRFDGGPEVKIVGLFRDAPGNSHLKPDMVISWETLVHFRGPDINTAWQWDGFFNYLLLHAENDPGEFEAKIPAYVQETIGENLEQYNSGVVYHLQPLKSIHLHSDFMMEAETNGNATTVYALIAVALFLVIIAWINYINLASARSLERAREVGMRKVTGARRTHLVSQFLVESLILNLVAILLAVVIVLLTGPLFDRLTGRSLDYSIVSNPGSWALILLLFVAGAVIAGIYPALLLSSFKPTTVFHGKLKVGGLGLRRLLVIFQFTTTLLLLAGTLTVYFQVSFMRNQDLGVDIKDVLVLQGPSVNDSTYSETFSAFKSELLRNPVIEKVSASTAVPGRKPAWNAGGIRRVSEGDDQGNQYRILGFDYEFADFYGLEILEGRNFSEEFGRNSETVLFNEAAIELMGFEDFSSAMNVPI
ncbi:MAG: ABC transporter permease, partial [Bacteroidetes bacterium]